MKYKIILFLVLFPVMLQAQKATDFELLIENFQSDLKGTWTLGIDSNSNNVDIRVYNKFKSLFDTSSTSTATVVDDINVFYQRNLGAKSGKYKTDDNRKPFDVYAHDVALQVNKVRIDSVKFDPSFKHVNKKPIGASYKMWAKRIAYLEKPKKYVLPDADSFAVLVMSSHMKEIRFESKLDYAKMVAGIKKGISDNPDSVYRFNITDSLLVDFFYSEKDSALKIKSIDVLDSKINCLNDLDQDALIDAEDSSAREFGEYSAKGRPDTDLDGVPDADDKCLDIYGSKGNHGCPDLYFSSNKQLDGFIGFQLNSTKINLPELNDLGYRDNSGNDAMDVLQSKKGSLKANKWVPGIYVGGNFSYFFGKKKKSGISLGFTYSSLNAEYILTSPILYTYKSFDGGDFYRRQITISKLDEQINTSVYNIPVMFNYRAYVNTKRELVVNFKLGPSLMIFNGKSNYNAMIDVGGIYQVDTINKDRITYYDHFDPGSTYNVYVNSEGINNQNTNPGAMAVFSQLPKSTDFATNKSYVGRQILTRTTVAINLGFSGQYAITTANYKGGFLSIKFGAHFIYAPLPAKKDKYKPIERTTDEYNSIYNSSAKSQYKAYGVTVGFVYHL